MTEAIHIQKDVPTAYWRINPRIRKNSSQLIRPSPQPQIKSPTGKRKTLDRFTHLLAVSALPGAELANEYLYSKYIKNLSVHTIRQTGRVVFSFLQFLHDGGSTIFTLTRREIGSFVECEQDRGLRPISIIGYLRALYPRLMLAVWDCPSSPATLPSWVRVVYAIAEKPRFSLSPSLPRGII